MKVSVTELAGKAQVTDPTTGQTLDWVDQIQIRPDENGNAMLWLGTNQFLATMGLGPTDGVAPSTTAAATPTPTPTSTPTSTPAATPTPAPTPTPTPTSTTPSSS